MASGMRSDSFTRSRTRSGAYAAAVVAGLLSTLLTVPLTAHADVPVESPVTGIVDITDSELASCLEAHIDGAVSGEITQEQLGEVISLNCAARNIADVAPLQYATNLESLDLSDNAIRDLSPLRSLPLLKTLAVDGQRIILPATTHMVPNTVPTVTGIDGTALSLSVAGGSALVGIVDSSTVSWTCSGEGTLAWASPVRLASGSTVPFNGEANQTVSLGAYGACLSAPNPTISGTYRAGQVLTAQTGVWAPAGLTHTYEWRRGGVKIAGATRPTYTLAAGDAGASISVAVTGSRTGFASVTRVSAARTVEKPLVAAVPTISGTNRVGQTLTAKPGSWAPSTVSFTYQWLRGGKPIANATGASYKLVTADFGAAISVTVTGKQSGYTTAAKTSSATAAVVGVLSATPVPKVAGTAKLGSTLTATAGTWAPATVALSYQWKRAGAAIAGATKSTYKLGTADLGKAITVTVTGKKSGYLSIAQTSAPTRAVYGTFTATPVPSFSGTMRAGYKLTASPGVWAPGNAALSYQWKRSGATIVGATGRTYVLKPTDVDRAITVTVTAKLANYLTVSKQSSARTVAATAYANCTAINAAYPHGIAKPGTKYDRVNGVNKAFKGQPYFSSSLYSLNTKSDRDKDGIACEK